MLDLLQYRIRTATGEGVARQQQERQPVGVRQPSRCHHIQRPRTDRRRGHHDLAAIRRASVGRGRQRHALLCLPAPGRQFVAEGVQGRAQPEHVAVSEDPENPRKERGFGAVEQLAALRDQPAYEGLRGGESYGHDALLPGPSAEVIGTRGSSPASSQVSRNQP